MREAVLDVGSNTAHLLVVDAHRGAAPLPALSVKRENRLAEHLTADGALSDSGVDALVSFIAAALVEAEDQGCESVTAFATSAIREASNTDEVLKLVRSTTGVDLQVLSGQEEARLTFLAVRRWFGWSSGAAGRLRQSAGVAGDRHRGGREPGRNAVLRAGGRPAHPGVAVRRRPAGTPTGTSASTSAQIAGEPGTVLRAGSKTTPSPHRRRSGHWRGSAGRRRQRRAPMFAGP